MVSPHLLQDLRLLQRVLTPRATASRPASVEALAVEGPERMEKLTGAWYGIDGNGGMGLLLTVIMDHSLIPY